MTFRSRLDCQRNVVNGFVEHHMQTENLPAPEAIYRDSCVGTVRMSNCFRNKLLVMLGRSSYKGIPSSKQSVDLTCMDFHHCQVSQTLLDSPDSSSILWSFAILFCTTYVRDRVAQCNPGLDLPCFVHRSHHFTGLFSPHKDCSTLSFQDFDPFRL